MLGRYGLIWHQMLQAQFTQYGKATRREVMQFIFQNRKMGELHGRKLQKFHTLMMAQTLPLQFMVLVAVQSSTLCLLGVHLEVVGSILICIMPEAQMAETHLPLQSLMQDPPLPHLTSVWMPLAIFMWFIQTTFGVLTQI